MHLFLSLILQLQAVGLQAGESLQQLAEAAKPANASQFVHGRVLNAFTGRPVPGAKIETWSEKRQGTKLARMMDDAPGKAFTLAIADQVFRPPSASRSASQFRHLVSGYGVPEYLPLPERAAMLVGAIASAFFPGLVMPAVTGAMRNESSSVILPAEEKKLKPLIRKRRADGMRMNLNQLGEAILGEGEAEKRI